MLPARFHIILAKSCLKLKKNLLTASYVGDEMKKMNKEVIDNDLIFLNCCLIFFTFLTIKKVVISKIMSIVMLLIYICYLGYIFSKTI